jgi:hypothetical protein
MKGALDSVLGRRAHWLLCHPEQPRRSGFESCTVAKAAHLLKTQPVFLIVADRCVLPLDVSPAWSTHDYLIDLQALPRGKHQFVHNGGFLGGELPFASLPVYLRIFVVIQVPEGDSRYHWLPDISDLGTDPEDARFGNLHLRELYWPAHSVWLRRISSAHGQAWLLRPPMTGASHQ